MAFDTGQATKFIEGIDLSGIPRGIVPQGATGAAGAVFDKAKAQAQVVGSGIFSFAEGVTVEVREAISDSALLAQLVANKAVKFEQDPKRWFQEYSKVLQNVGWVVQDLAWNNYAAEGLEVDVHEKIVDVMAAVLGPSAAALAIITATIGALKAMNSSSPWITLFKRESQKSRIARFQIGLVDKDADGGVFVVLIGCVIKAQEDITQVLFFKVKKEKASFEGSSAKVSINQPALARLDTKIREKIVDYQDDYLSTILNV